MPRLRSSVTECWVGLVFCSRRRADERHERDVHVEDVVAADVLAELPDRLEERQDLDVADRAADLGDHDVDVVGGEREDALLDLVGDVRDHLHGLAEVLALALLGEHRLVDRAGRGVRAPGERDVDEALVVPEVEVGLALVVGDEHLAVLEGVHRAGVDVDVGVELLHRDPEATTLEQSPERRRREPLAEARCHSTGHEDVLGQPPNLRVDVGLTAADLRRRRCPGPGSPGDGSTGLGHLLVIRRCRTVSPMSETVGAADARLPKRPSATGATAVGEPAAARWRGWQVMVGLALLAIVVAPARVPLVAPPRVRRRDLRRVGARHAARPRCRTASVFSAQGPLHFPLLYLGDLLGLRTIDGPARHADARGHRGDDRGVGDRASLGRPDRRADRRRARRDIGIDDLDDRPGHRRRPGRRARSCARCGPRSCTATIPDSGARSSPAW